MQKEKNLGLGSVIATGVGLIVATSCLLSIGQGTSAIGTPFIISMTLACIFNILTALSICELNALMPNLTGGMAQFTLACCGPLITIVTNVGGFLCCQVILGSSEAAMFGNTLSQVLPAIPLPGSAYSICLVLILCLFNLRGVDMFAKIQNIVAYTLIASLIVMGILGYIKINPSAVIQQPAVLSAKAKDIFSLLGLSFFLFIGVEFIVPISSEVKNARKIVPLGMVLSLVIILAMQILITLGFKNYTSWEELSQSTIPHVLYGSALLGKAGTVWMSIVSLLAVVSTVNTIMFGIPQLCYGMAKIDLLPKFFMKKNSKNCPYIGLLLVTLALSVINASGLSSSEKLVFLINTGCVFWIFCYVMLHIDVIILRIRMPNAPRTFKLPLGILVPLIGIVGNLYMIWNIAPDSSNRLIIFAIFAGVSALLAAYAFIWVRIKMKRPLFKALAIKEVMAMDTDLYQIRHYPLLAKKLNIQASPDIEPVNAETNTGTRPELKLI